MLPNKCVNIVRSAHSTRKLLRSSLACYARRLAAWVECIL